MITTHHTRKHTKHKKGQLRYRWGNKNESNKHFNWIFKWNSPISYIKFCVAVIITTIDFTLIFLIFCGQNSPSTVHFVVTDKEIKKRCQEKFLDLEPKIVVVFTWNDKSLYIEKLIIYSPNVALTLFIQPNFGDVTTKWLNFVKSTDFFLLVYRMSIKPCITYRNNNNHIETCNELQKI